MELSHTVVKTSQCCDGILSPKFNKKINQNDDCKRKFTQNAITPDIGKASRKVILV